MGEEELYPAEHVVLRVWRSSEKTPSLCVHAAELNVSRHSPVLVFLPSFHRVSVAAVEPLTHQKTLHTFPGGPLCRRLVRTLRMCRAFLPTETFVPDWLLRGPCNSCNNKYAMKLHSAPQLRFSRCKCIKVQVTIATKLQLAVVLSLMMRS